MDTFQFKSTEKQRLSIEAETGFDLALDLIPEDDKEQKTNRFSQQF